MGPGSMFPPHPKGNAKRFAKTDCHIDHSLGDRRSYAGHISARLTTKALSIGSARNRVTCPRGSWLGMGPMTGQIVPKSDENAGFPRNRNRPS